MALVGNATPSQRLRIAVPRARAYLDQYLFLEGPPPPRVTWRRAGVGVGVALLGVAVLLARMWPSKPLDSLWAEDGTRWLTDALGRGFADVLTSTYDGYLQTSSRLVAEPVAWLPVGSFAAVMAICGAAIVVGSALAVWRASAGHIRSPLLRAALAALVVLLGVVSTETLDNVTDSMWFLMFASFWILLWRPATFARAAGAGALVLVTALSNAGILVFAPVWLLRVLAARDRRDGVICGGFAVGVCVQLAYSWSAPALGEGAPLTSQQIAATQPHWDWSLVPAYAQRIVGGALTGQRIDSFLWQRLGTGLVVFFGVALVAFVVAAGAGRSRSRIVVPIIVAESLALFLVSGYERWFMFGVGFLWRGSTANTVDARYMVGPTLLLLSALFIWLDARPGFLARRVWSPVHVAVASLLLVAALFSFNVGDLRIRGALRWSEAVDGARTGCRQAHVASVLIPISPFTPALGFFSIHIPCNKLTS